MLAALIGVREVSLRSPPLHMHDRGHASSKSHRLLAQAHDYADTLKVILPRHGYCRVPMARLHARV